MFKCDTFTAKYISHSTVKDYEGKNAIRIVFHYTNNDKSAQEFALAAYVMVFQNGVELDNAMLDDYKKEDNNAIKKIKPGTAIKVASSFVLEDKSDVQLEISDLYSPSGAKLTKTLKL